MDWTEEAIATLRQLWAEGHSTAEIGRRMGISKNAVVGKAHRLNLPARPSPIRRPAGQAPAARAPRLAPRPGLPRPLPILPVVRAAAADRQEHRPAQITPQARTAPLRVGHATCCWPIGEPGKPGFRFCGAPAMPGKPYCEEHAAIAYVRPKPERREDAA